MEGSHATLRGSSWEADFHKLSNAHGLVRKETWTARTKLTVMHEMYCLKTKNARAGIPLFSSASPT